MKKLLFAVTMLALQLSVCGQTKNAQPLKTETDSLSYCIGLSIGKSLADGDLQDIEVSKLAQGITDQFKQNPMMTVEQAEMYIQKVLMARQEAKSLEYKIKQEEFIATNKKAEGVKTTPSGLQYKVISEGTGPKPTAADVVTVHYTGTLTDGTVFDSSVQRGEPATFGLSQVIPGWTEGLQLMSTGSKYQFFIPQELGYGASGMGEIKPYSALIFEVELIAIGNQ